MSLETDIDTGKPASGWSILWGALLLVSGVLAIALPFVSAVGVALLLGYLLLFGGILQLLFAFHSHHVEGFVWKLFLAVLYGAIGAYLLARPLAGVASLTLVVGTFLLLEGIVEIVLFFNIRRSARAGWVLFDGIITLLLGGLILAQWPSSATWVIGTLVGISLIFSGASRLMLGSTGRRPGAALQS